MVVLCVGLVLGVVVWGLVCLSGALVLVVWSCRCWGCLGVSFWCWVAGVLFVVLVVSVRCWGWCLSGVSLCGGGGRVLVVCFGWSLSRQEGPSDC